VSRPRPALQRVATALLALLYFAAWGEPIALHPCPMHDGPGVTAVHARAAGAPAAQAGHGVHTAAAADHGAPAEGDHACQCLGHGCCTAVAAGTAAQRVRWFAVVTRRADPPGAAPLTAPRAHAARLLPPATGPPVLG